jgi:hypothetical protein
MMGDTKTYILSFKGKCVVLVPGRIKVIITVEPNNSKSLIYLNGEHIHIFTFYLHMMIT